MSALNEPKVDNNQSSRLLSLIGDTLMHFGSDIENDIGFGDGIANQTTAFIELAAGSLSWILVNRDEGYTNDYIEDLFKSVRSRTLAQMAGRRTHHAESSARTEKA
jgi:hypothetical protein